MVMTDLSTLLSDDKEPAFVDDLAEFVDATVEKQSGISGMALKGAMATARKIDDDAVRHAIRYVLPAMLKELQPYWDDYEASVAPDFGEFVAPRSVQLADGVMRVADDKANALNNRAMQKVYATVRSRITKVIEPEVPALGRILEDHMSS